MAVIIRHFDSMETAQEVVQALNAAGVSEEHIGFLTKAGVSGHFDAPNSINTNDMSATEGAMLGTLAGMVTAVVAMATPLGPIVAAGPLLGTLIGALAGAATGGVVASLIDSGVDEGTARRLAATLEDDKAVLVSVEVDDDEAAGIRALLAQTEELHADELRYFQAYHQQHQDVDFAEFQHAYHFGYRAAAANPVPFADAELALRQSYTGDFERDREAIRVGYERYLNTVQVV
ncbi:MAG TPA: hypothetical protein VF707_20675 [Ardenticatenaceae bacterium]|jgi:uncharacterized membrane protein